jgi:ubiquinone/menaquinone biosynthesis C-methylase UbiE
MQFPQQREASHDELRYRDTAAAGYDDGVGCRTRQVVPGLLRMADLLSGLRVLDIAAGTGLASEAAAATVGTSGHVTAADISPAMLKQARKRLSGLAHVALDIQDGTRLTFPDAHFDRVICNMGLMYFPDAARGLAWCCLLLRRYGKAEGMADAIGYPRVRFSTFYRVAETCGDGYETQ